MRSLDTRDWETAKVRVKFHFPRSGKILVYLRLAGKTVRLNGSTIDRV